MARAHPFPNRLLAIFSFIRFSPLYDEYYASYDDSGECYEQFLTCEVLCATVFFNALRLPLII